MVTPAIFSKSITARSERPISRWISTDRPSTLFAEVARCLRVSVEYGSIEYSALSQPFGGSRAFIHVGTRFSAVAAHMTFVFPKDTKTDPVALGAKFGSNLISRSWSTSRPSGRICKFSLSIV